MENYKEITEAVKKIAFGKGSAQERMLEIKELFLDDITLVEDSF